jgi:hypothetical protein
MSERPFPWNDPRLTEEEYEDGVVIEILASAYMLGYTYVDKKFRFFNQHIASDELDFQGALDFLNSFESRFQNEVWFQLSDSASRRAALAKRMQSGEGGQ